MKHFLSMLLLLAAGIAQAQAPAPTQAVPAQDDNQAKARAILDQMIAALGGQAYLTYTDCEQDGRGYGFAESQAYGGGAGSGPGIGVAFHRTWKWPDKERFDLTATYFGYNPIPFSKQSSKATVVEIFNGDRGYEVSQTATAFQPREQMAEYTRRRARSLEHVLREWLKQPGMMLFYEGQALAEQKTTDQVSVATDAGDMVTIYIDIFTHLPVKKTYTFRNRVYHDKDIETEVWGNYRTIQGIATPFNYLRRLNDKTVEERFLNRTTYNAGVADALFVPQHPPPGDIK